MTGFTSDNCSAIFRELEDSLSAVPFFGISLGPTIGSTLVTEFLNYSHRQTFRRRLADRARRWRYSLRPIRLRGRRPELTAGQVLLTLLNATPRLVDLVLPILIELQPVNCQVVCRSQEALAVVPPEAERVVWKQLMWFDTASWRKEYRTCWPAWSRHLRAACRKHSMLRDSYENLAVHLCAASQQLAGCLRFLQACRPAAIVTEHDRAIGWSSLVLAARSLNIPCFTLVHGVLSADALGYVPLLADKAFCWGEFDRRKFLAAGEAAEKLIVGGCPRLTRELTPSAAEGRRKLGIAADRPVVLLGTCPVNLSERMQLARLFCAAAASLPNVSAVVRLHPQEDLATYAHVIAEHPRVRFITNADASLDESLAAADVVVVHNSGLGGDALVKRRPVIVVDMPDAIVGHGQDLIDYAGCPRAATAEELAGAIERLIFDETFRREHFVAAERYVGEFCALFGRDSARAIADAVRAAAASRAEVALQT